MKESELIDNISDMTGVHCNDVALVLESMCHIVKQTLIEGGHVKIPLGAFVARKIKPSTRKSVVFKSGIVIPLSYIPAHKKPKFRFSVAIRNEVKKATTVKGTEFYCKDGGCAKQCDDCFNIQ